MTRSIFSDEYKFLKKFLKQERLKSKLTQVQLSLMLEKPSTYVNKYELGERRLDVVELVEIARVLKFDPLELFNYLCKMK